MDEHRHVGAQGQTQFRQFRQGQSGAPQVVKRHESRGSVGAAAAQPAAHRQTLGEANRRALANAGGFLQQTGGAHRQIGIHRHAGKFAVAGDDAVGTRGKPQPIAVIQELKHGL